MMTLATRSACPGGMSGEGDAMRDDGPIRSYIQAQEANWMTPCPSTITQADIARTVKAVSGLMAVGRVEVDHVKGTVVILPVNTPEAGAARIEAMIDNFK